MKLNEINIHILIEKEENLYSSVCLELDVASPRKTIAEAKKNIYEAIELCLEDVLEAGDGKDFIPQTKFQNLKAMNKKLNFGIPIARLIFGGSLNLWNSN